MVFQFCMENQFGRNWFFFEFALKITTVQKLSNQVQVLSKVVMKIQHWMQSINNNLSAKFFAILHALTLNVDILVHISITNCTIKSLITLLEKLMHSMQLIS